MPEGDTIFRTAVVLRSVLVGGTVTAATAQAQPGMRRVPDLDRLVGAAVTSVESRGKQLLIGFDSGLTLRRSEERRVGKECSLLCRSRWSPYH